AAGPEERRLPGAPLGDVETVAAAHDHFHALSAHGFTSRASLPDSENRSVGALPFENFTGILTIFSPSPPSSNTTVSVAVAPRRAACSLSLGSTRTSTNAPSRLGTSTSAMP